MKFLLSLAIAAVLSLTAACETFKERESSARLVTMYATLKVIDGDTEKAARVQTIASEVQAYASAETFLTVDLLIGELKDQINWDNLDTADTLLVTELVNQLRDELIARLGPGVLPEDLRLAVNTVSSWVIAAAQMT